MRKALVILLAFFVLCSCGAAMAYSEAMDPREEVTVEEILKAGDSAAAEGLSLEVRTSYRDNLFWNTRFTAGNSENAESDYRVSVKKDYGDWDYEPSGVNLNIMLEEGNFDFSDGDYEAAAELEGIGVAYRELWLETKPGEEREKSIYLKDYLDYYPISGEIEVPGLTVDFNFYRFNSDFLEGHEKAAVEEAYKAFNDYFKIPVLENEKQIISIAKNEKGQLRSRGGGTDGEAFYMWADTVVLPDAVYFTIHNRSSQETIVDTSLIPGGYGIYRLPYFASEGGSEVYLDELSTAKSLDERFEVIYMLTDEPMEKLILIGRLDNSLRMLIIDVATMDTLQDIEIASDGNTGCWQYYDGGDFIVLFIDDMRTALVERQPSGEYILRFVIEDEADGRLYNRYDVQAVAWDGEKLAMSGFKDIKDINERYVADFYYAVYDETGLLCFVDCDSSLSLLEEVQWDCVRGLDVDPIKLEWK